MALAALAVLLCAAFMLCGFNFASLMFFYIVFTVFLSYSFLHYL